MEPAVPGVSAYSLPKNGEKKQKTIVDRTVGGPKERCSKMICRSQEKEKKTGGGRKEVLPSERKRRRNEKGSIFWQEKIIIYKK